MTAKIYGMAAKIMEHYGAEAQKDILVEECADWTATGRDLSYDNGAF